MQLVKRTPTNSNLAWYEREFNRLFGDSCGCEADSIASWSPAVDIYEDENHFTVSASLPGMSRQDVKVSLENGILTISGERSLANGDKADNYTRLEQAYGAFARSFSLPDTIDLPKVEAVMDKGVLTVTLPKAEAARPKQIDIKVH